MDDVEIAKNLRKAIKDLQKVGAHLPDAYLEDIDLICQQIEIIAMVYDPDEESRIMAWNVVHDHDPTRP